MFIQPQNSLFAAPGSSRPGPNGSGVFNESSFAIILQDTSNESKDLNREFALINDVGFYKYQIIMQTVQQIERALEKAMTDFPAYQEDLKGIEDLFSEKLPTSVIEAMSRLNEVLAGVPEEIRESFKEKVFQYLEDGKKKDEQLNQGSIIFNVFVKGVE